jgi:hypothetical protein
MKISVSRFFQSDAPETEMERGFWARADPESSLFNWKCPDAPDTAVFVSEAVHTGAEAVTFVFRDAADGAWQFLGDSMTGGGEPRCLLLSPSRRKRGN